MPDHLLDRYRGKRVFLTGNTGFKGSWMTIWLRELGAEVYGYALPPKQELDNFIHCGLEDKIDQTYGDVRDAEKLREAYERARPDYAFHLAAQALVLDSYADPAETYFTNVMGAVNFLDAVRKDGRGRGDSPAGSREGQGLRSAVVITSDKAYENKEVVWGYREDDQLGGKDPYSSSKACAELVVHSYCQSFFREQNLPVATTRAGNVIGGGDWSANRLFPDIFRALRAGQTVDIRNPAATRPWEHVLEPLAGYLQLALYTEDQNLLQSAWNFGPSTYRHYSVGEVVTEIAKHAPVNYHLNTVPSGPHEANFLKLDITKAANYLKWFPQLDFAEAIKFTTEGYLAQDSDDLYGHRVGQIEEYTEMARRGGTVWAT